MVAAACKLHLGFGPVWNFCVSAYGSVSLEALLLPQNYSEIGRLRLSLDSNICFLFSLGIESPDDGPAKSRSLIHRSCKTSQVASEITCTSCYHAHCRPTSDPPIRKACTTSKPQRFRVVSRVTPNHSHPERLNAGFLPNLEPMTPESC